MKIFIYISLLLLPIISALGQQSESKGQTARGKIIDRSSGNGVAGAEIELLNHAPRLATKSDENGNFIGSEKMMKMKMKMVIKKVLTRREVGELNYIIYITKRSCINTGVLNLKFYLSL